MTKSSCVASLVALLIHSPPMALADAGATPSIIDQVAYHARLIKLRPDLMANECRNNLVLKPIYREHVLAGNVDEAKIRQREYTLSLQKLDRAWADRQRAKALEIRQAIDQLIRSHGLDPSNKSDGRVWQFKAALPFFVAEYDHESYIGYHVGPPARADQNGFMPKVFFEFHSLVDQLTPGDYVEFTRKLSKAGYNGDTKIQLRPGNSRYHFNNLIAHAASIPDALIAERAGLKHFGSRLASIARGFDVNVDPAGTKIIDWHSYLCAFGSSELPPAVLDFIAYKVPATSPGENRRAVTRSSER